MDIFSYIWPAEPWALVDIVFQLLLFFFWIILLASIGISRYKKRSLIDACSDVYVLRRFLVSAEYNARKDAGANENSESKEPDGKSPSNLPESDEVFKDQHLFIPKLSTIQIEKFADYCESRGVKKKTPLYLHLEAIYTAGITESTLDIKTLLNNTANRLTVSNSWLRSILSLFIILGLLGTLLGLAESLSHLSTISLGGAEFSNESLKTGLEVLLGKLGSAFAPSIWGVFLTFLGIMIFATYLRWSTYPVLKSLEYETLTNWVPVLMPSPSQRVYEKLRLTERTARNVEELVKTVETNTGALARNIEAAGSALGELNSAAGGVADSCFSLREFSDGFTKNLDSFSTKFQTSVETLTPFSDSLKELYGEMRDNSAEFQKGVQKTVEDSETIRNHVQEEFDKQREQSNSMLEALRLYETAYLNSRESTDEKLTKTLGAAESALESITQQNEVVIKGLVESLGDPLQKQLVEKLSEISEVSKSTLGDVSSNSNKKLDELMEKIDESLAGVAGKVELVGTRLDNLETPLKRTAEFMGDSAKKTAESMDATLTNFDSRTETWLKEIRDEFEDKNTQGKDQNRNLKDLNDQINTAISELKRLSSSLNKSRRGNSHPRSSGSNRAGSGEPRSEDSIVPKKGFARRTFDRIVRRKT